LPIFPSSYHFDPFSAHHPFHNGCSLTLFQHGRGGTSAIQRDTSLYQNYASASDYIIVYPQGLACDHGTAWQGPTYACPDVNDIDFVSDLLDYLEDNFCIDTNRVYASGKSNGGGFVDTIAGNDLGDRFAAFAMASAALYTDTSLETYDKKRAILEAHGDADTTIPYAGGEALGGPIPDIGQWVGWWGDRDCGAGGAMESVKKMEGYEIETLSCSGGLSDVVSHYRLAAPAAHCWPNTQGDNYDSLKYPQGCGNSRALDFTAVVLEWFARWNLENAP
jgi:poly(3-hydroxybutyrate) depolymerase